MRNYLTVKHSFNSGDLIVLLSGLKQLYENTGKKIVLYQYLNLPAFYYDGAVHPVQDASNNMVCMNESMWKMVLPLLESQPYIEKAAAWEGQEAIDYDIDVTRDSKVIPMPAGLIHHYACAIYPEMDCNLVKSWVEVMPLGIINSTLGEIALSDKIIINRTERYQNPYISYFFLKKYQEQLLFAGTEKEYNLFCNTLKIEMPRILVNDFLQLARCIYSCKGFLGNQSFCWHLADAQKVPRVLELCTQFPNTFPTGENGHAFYKQKALEYYFEKLINTL
jgi:hypothetical protein